MEQQSVYSGQKDEELVKLVQQGDKRAQEHLLNKYKPLVKTRARTYFLIGAASFFRARRLSSSQAGSMAREWP